MSAPVIEVRGLGKEYRLGARRERYPTLRERLASGFVAPLRRLRAVARGHSVVPSKDTVWALSEVSFAVERGEVMGIVGRNGAGKTTLLKVLSRITVPTTGEAILRGRVASLLEVGTGFHPELTGRENVYLNGAILGMRRVEVAARFGDIVAFAEVERFLDTQIKHYSSGMYLRLAFAVAAHLEPEILLVDEVLAVGDAVFQRRCLGKMRDVARSGRTVLFVSHDMEAVQRLCSRCLWIDGGRLALDGPTGHVVARYLAHGEGDLPSGYRAAEGTGGGDPALLVEAQVLGAAGAPTFHLRFAEPFAVRMAWHHRAPIGGARYFLRLFDSRERLVLASNTEHTGVETETQGRHEVICRFDANVLVPGTYHLSLGCFVPPRQMLHRVERCVGFEVISSPYDDAMPQIHPHALVAPPARWQELTVRPLAGA